MFFLITILFCYPFKVVGGDNRVSKSWCVAIAFFTVIYGIVIEFVQKFFVSGRSFDATDILFDGLGSSVAVIVVSAFFEKK
jgi:VanZ family protein